MAARLQPAPRWAWTIMTLGVLAVVALSYLTINRPLTPELGPSATAAAATAARSPSPSPAAPAPVRVLVVGDDYTVGSPGGGVGAAGWPQLVAADLGAAGRPVTVQVAAANGAGYRLPGPNGETLPLLAANAGTDFDLVVFFGSRNDNGTTANVQAAAGQAFTAARAASPRANLLVIGPASSSVPPPGYVMTDRDAVRAAATAAGVLFIDPLVEGWFTGQEPNLIGVDGVHPTNAGHRYLADRIRPRVQAVLPPPR